MADVSEFLDHTNAQLAAIAADGLTKRERLITSPQGSRISVGDRQAINLCANNYLGLANHPVLRAAADEAMETHGYGMASVRFICGTQDLHRELELRIARWLGHDDSILFASCFDANGALFEPLLGPEDAIISDALNHASIIDGIRLCKAKRYRYANSDMADLEKQLQQARADGARFIMIATDGVFSMDGYLAKMPEIRALADQYGALVMVDDCHSAGILGPKGAGTAAHFGTRADVITGTLGKALGGALGGYIAGPQPVIDLIEGADDLRADLFRKTQYWRDGLAEAGFDLLPGETAIVPVMLGEATLAQQMAAELDKRGVFVAGFFFPVVPRGQARIRTQMNAAIAMEDLDIALQAFREAGKETGVI